jgi:hypothetical protein
MPSDMLTESTQVAHFTEGQRLLLLLLPQGQWESVRGDPNLSHVCNSLLRHSGLPCSIQKTNFFCLSNRCPVSLLCPTQCSRKSKADNLPYGEPVCLPPLDPACVCIQCPSWPPPPPSASKEKRDRLRKK